MKLYDLNTSSVVDSRKLGYITMPGGGVRFCNSCTKEESVSAGYLDYIADVVPNHYEGGVPVLVREGDTMRCTWPNPVFQADSWRAQLLVAIQIKKIAKRDSGFLVDGVLFDSDSGANVQYLNFFTQVSVNPAYRVTNWKASNGTWVEMDITLFMKVSAAFGANTTAAFDWQASMQEALTAAPDTYAGLKSVEDLINAE